MVVLQASPSVTYNLRYHSNGQLRRVEYVEGEFDVIVNYYDYRGRRILAGQEGTTQKVYTYDIADRMLNETHLTALNLATDENPIVDYVYVGNRRVGALMGEVYAGESPCFVATAAYGTSMSVDIQALREFRDRVIRRFDTGKRFVEWYYEKGGDFFRWVRGHEGFRAIVRVALIVPVAVSKVVFCGSVLGKVVLMFLVLVSGMILVVFGKRRG